MNICQITSMECQHYCKTSSSQIYSGNKSTIYIIFFGIFVFEDQSCFLQKVCLIFLSRILAKQTTYSSSTPFLEPVCKNLPTVYLLFFLDTIFFCKKTRLFFGTEIGHNRLWPIWQIISICIEFSVCLMLSCQ